MKQMGDRARIVWHYRADDEARTFQIHYALRGLASPTTTWST